MAARTPDFSLAVAGVDGLCPAGETHAQAQIARRATPVLACEGPCIRGEIARLAANRVAAEVPGLARACHAETFTVPHSARARWVRGAPRSIVVDGCFLSCHGRTLRGIVGADKVVQIDAMPLHRKYGGVFAMNDVPEAERQEVARAVAERIAQRLAREGLLPATVSVPAS